MVSKGRKGQNNPIKHTHAVTLLNCPQLRNKALLMSSFQKSQYVLKGNNIKRQKKCLGEQIVMRFTAVCTGKSNLTRQTPAYK